MRERLTGPKLAQILIVLVILAAAFFLRTCSNEEEVTETVQKISDYCDLSHATCVQQQQELTVSAQLLSDDLQAETPFSLQVVLSDPDAVITRSVLEGESMYMGTLPALIEHTGEGVWRGSALVGSCSEERMLWAWVLDVRQGEETHRLKFLFEVRR
ncbi:hypothetical protein [Oceanimonas baumannii]|uniref:Uncharacterized protein n=1 Tax=Oceanimonas baumannii TaxID=129578 RepID=A0A235CH32_9GAMM|nr:hypothetical protein [Oceanimonas baumannii]OYD23833.1 hypothetical protein B6S09_10225 [Oceanimonas baumannii]TDW58842.1 hypothetical protein LY04_02198 [Oceanimonas baumannii]